MLVGLPNSSLQQPVTAATSLAGARAAPAAPAAEPERWTYSASCSSPWKEFGFVKLPNASLAIIDSAKLRDYLLSPAHPVGRFKAPFFAALGYAQEQWQQLEADLRAQHL